MRFWTAYAIFALSIVSKSWGAPDGGHGSPSDLIAPAVNVAILVGFLVWKLKGPLSSYFNTRSEEVSSTLERASLKSKEAQMMLENEERKVAGLSSEIQAINSQTEADVSNYEKNLAREIEEKTHKLKSDANLKIQADKKAVMDQLNSELLEKVISEAKTTIKTNEDYKSKASAKLLQGLQ